MPGETDRPQTNGPHVPVVFEGSRATRAALHWRQFRDAPVPGAVFMGVDCIRGRQLSGI
jgi:hypothetical protein